MRAVELAEVGAVSLQLPCLPGRVMRPVSGTKPSCACANSRHQPFWGSSLGACRSNTALLTTPVLACKSCDMPAATRPHRPAASSVRASPWPRCWPRVAHPQHAGVLRVRYFRRCGNAALFPVAWCGARRQRWCVRRDIGRALDGGLVASAIRSPSNGAAILINVERMADKQPLAGVFPGRIKRHVKPRGKPVRRFRRCAAPVEQGGDIHHPVFDFGEQPFDIRR